MEKVGAKHSSVHNEEEHSKQQDNENDITETLAEFEEPKSFTPTAQNVIPSDQMFENEDSATNGKPLPDTEIIHGNEQFNDTNSFFVNNEDEEPGTSNTSNTSHIITDDGEQLALSTDMLTVESLWQHLSENLDLFRSKYFSSRYQVGHLC